MTLNNKFKHAIIAFVIWFVGALIMTICYTYLKEIGFIWDNVYAADLNEPEWNTRKVIFALAGVFWFILLVVRILSVSMQDTIE